MQTEFETDYPGLDIQIIGINEVGQEESNSLATDGVDMPWLQDVDDDEDGQSDVWGGLWDISWRDVVILDADNVQVGVFHVNDRPLADAEHNVVLDNYVELRDMFIAAATPWRNPDDPLDVNDDGHVSPIDALVVINMLNVMGPHAVSDPSAGGPPPPYYDSSGDGFVSPLDALRVINHLNRTSSAEGEPAVGDYGFMAASVLQLAAASEKTVFQRLAASVDDQAIAFEPEAVDRVFAEHSPTWHPSIRGTSGSVHDAHGYSTREAYRALSRASTCMLPFPLSALGVPA